MKKPLHVVFLARWYPHRYDPMYGLFVKRHAEAASQKHKISVIYVHEDPTITKNYEVEIHKGIINEYFFYYKKSNSSSLFSKLRNLYWFLRGNYFLLRKIPKPDLIHVHILTRLGLLALIAKQISNIPYIITEHWSRYQDGRTYTGRLRKWLTKIVVNNATQVTTVSKQLEMAMKSHKLEHKKYILLPNVVDTKLFNYNAYKQKNKIFQFIHISCFDDEPKNISGILHTVKLLSEERTDFLVTMVGDGKDYSKMIQLANELKLQDYVKFTGLQEGNDLANILRNSDALLLFSNYENMPVVISEALCSGIPVLSSNVGGIREFVNETNGILVEPQNQQSLKSGMKKMIDNYTEYDREWIANQSQHIFSRNSIANLIDQIYSEAAY